MKIEIETRSAHGINDVQQIVKGFELHDITVLDIKACVIAKEAWANITIRTVDDLIGSIQVTTTNQGSYASFNMIGHQTQEQDIDKKYWGPGFGDLWDLVQRIVPREIMMG